MTEGSGRAAAPRRRCSRGSWARGGSFVGPLPRRPLPRCARSSPPRPAGSGSGLAAEEEEEAAAAAEAPAAQLLRALAARDPALPAHSPQALAWE